MIGRTGQRSCEPFSDERAREVIAARLGERGPLLEILHDLQGTFGHLDPAITPLVAEALNLSRAEVHGVISFYRDFHREPPGRTVVQICRAEACQAMGAEGLLARVSRRLGVEVGATTPDGAVTLRDVFCLGNCALAPSALVGGRLVGRFSEAVLDELLDRSEPGAT